MSNSRYPPSNVPGLIKQTYSAMVTLPSANNSQPIVRKWHLTAYFEHNDLNSLLTIDRDPELCNIVVPPGVYRSGKSRQRRHSGENPGGLRWINVDGSGQVSDTGRPVSSSPDTSSPNSPSNSPSVRPAQNPDAYLPTSSQMASPVQNQNPNIYHPYNYPPQPQLPPIAVGFANPPPSSHLNNSTSRPRVSRTTSGDSRSREDARVIGLLNSRTSLA